MIRKKTTLVLGAGASKPYGFPTAGELRDRILSVPAEYPIDHPNWQEHGLPYPLHPSFQLGKLERFQKDLRASKVLSIDTFLSHVFDAKPDYVTIGKAAIAAALIPLEDPTVFEGNIENDWYSHLVEVMGRTYDELCRSAEHLSVITFNYDRSLEYYLFNAFQHLHGKEKAIHLIRTVAPVHVYGQLGEPEFLDPSGRQYSTTRDHYSVAKCALAITVISEGMDDSDEFRRAHSLIAKAEHFCFLGFGFDALNMKRLDAQRFFKGERLFSTAFHMTGTQRSAAVSSGLNGPITFGTQDEDALTFLQNHNVFGHV